MTSKKKAKELVEKFYTTRSEDDLLLTIYWTSAKGCALIVVDEVLRTMDEEDNYVMYKYWEQVKQEIKKI